METLRKFGLEHHDLPTMVWNAAVLLRVMALDVDSRNTKAMETLRKFGLEHHDLPTMVWNAAVLLRVMALDVDSRNTKGIHIIFYFMAAMIVGFYFYTYHVSTYWYIFWRGSDDLLFNILLLSLAISSFIGVVKLIYLYFNGPGLKRIVSGYLECDAQLIPGTRMTNNVSAMLRVVKKRALVFWLIIIGNGIAYVMTPRVLPGKHLVEDDQVLLGLEPMFESPNYEIANTALFFGVFLTVYAPANITAFLIIIVGYTEAQLLALSEDLLQLWDDAQNHYKLNQADLNTDNDGSPITIDFENIKENILNDFIHHRLVSILKSHATNINLIKLVEGTFQNAIAIEFILLSSGLIMELLGGLENTYMEVPFAMVQVSMDCLTGQRLIDANIVFENAVYACNWEQFNSKNRKLVLVMLQNAQKSMQLSAGGLATLSYMSLMSVFKSIYSAYTALHSVMD